MLAGRAVVGAFELAENTGLLGLLQSRTGVGNDEGQLLVLARHLDQHAAGFGELDGVADKVEQHLPQPADVRGDHARRLGRDMNRDLDAFFMGARRHQFADAVDQVFQIAFLVPQVQAARLDRRHIQQILDQRQKRHAGLACSLQVTCLLRCRLGLREQVRHAENAVERRADFVADGGQEP